MERSRLLAELDRFVEHREDALNLNEGATSNVVRELDEAVQVPGLGRGTTWLVNMFFEQEVGSLSGVAGNENALWVAHLSEKRLEGIAPLEEVRDRVEREVKNRKKGEKADMVITSYNCP